MNCNMTEEERQVGELRKKGLGYKKVSNELGISESTIQNICNRHGFKNPTIGVEIKQDCEVCGNDFVKNSDNHKFCSRSCREESKRPTKCCHTCGSEMKSRSMKYCSDNCRPMQQAKLKRIEEVKARDKEILRLRSEGMTYVEIGERVGLTGEHVGKFIRENGEDGEHDLTCKHCGKRFKSVVITTMYCGGHCRRTFSRLRRRREQGTDVYKRKCRHCEEEFTTENVRKLNCSDSCRHKHNRRNYVYAFTCGYCGDRYERHVARNNCTNECKETELKELEGIKEERNKKDALVVRLVKAVDPQRHRECKWCGSDYYARYIGSSYCSEDCSRIHYHKLNYIPKRYNHKCRECGKHYTDGQYNSGGCSKQCKNKYTNRAEYVRRRDRLVANGRVDWSISVERLAKRDNDTCYLCNNKIDMKDFRYSEEGYFIAGNHYGSVDHVVPLSKGGTHTYDNVKLAHRLCNSMKSDNDIQEKRQLTLF